MSNRLHICQTCPRDHAPGADGRTRGQHLTEAVLAHRIGLDLVVRKAPCLSGCLNPCNVSFRAPGKASLRFSRLDASFAGDLLRFAELYAASADGVVDSDAWPARLSGRLTAFTPPPAGSGPDAQ